VRVKDSKDRRLIASPTLHRMSRSNHVIDYRYTGSLKSTTQLYTNHVAELGKPALSVAMFVVVVAYPFL